MAGRPDWYQSDKTKVKIKYRSVPPVAVRKDSYAAKKGHHGFRKSVSRVTGAMRFLKQSSVLLPAKKIQTQNTVKKKGKHSFIMLLRLTPWFYFDSVI